MDLPSIIALTVGAFSALALTPLALDRAERFFTWVNVKTMPKAHRAEERRRVTDLSGAPVEQEVSHEERVRLSYIEQRAERLYDAMNDDELWLRQKQAWRRQEHIEWVLRFKDALPEGEIKALDDEYRQQYPKRHSHVMRENPDQIVEIDLSTAEGMQLAEDLEQEEEHLSAWRQTRHGGA